MIVFGAGFRPGWFLKSEKCPGSACIVGKYKYRRGTWSLAAWARHRSSVAQCSLFHPLLWEVDSCTFSVLFQLKHSVTHPHPFQAVCEPNPTSRPFQGHWEDPSTFPRKVLVLFIYLFICFVLFRATLVAGRVLYH